MLESTSTNQTVIPRGEVAKAEKIDFVDIWE